MIAMTANDVANRSNALAKQPRLVVEHAGV